MKYFMSRLTTQQKIANARSNGQDYTVYLGNGKGSITYHANGVVTVDKTADKPADTGTALNVNNAAATVAGSMVRQDIGNSSANVTTTIGPHVAKTEISAQTGSSAQNTTNKYAGVGTQQTTTPDVDVVVDLNNGGVIATDQRNTNISAGTQAGVDVVVDLATGAVSNNVNTLGIDTVVDLNQGINTTPSIGTAAYTDGKVYAEADVDGNLVAYTKLQTTMNSKEVVPDVKGSITVSVATPAINGEPVIAKSSNTRTNIHDSTTIESATTTSSAINGVTLTDKYVSKTNNTDDSTLIEPVTITSPAINGVPLADGGKYALDTYPTDKPVVPGTTSTWLFGSTVARDADTNKNVNTHCSVTDTTATNTGNAVTLNQQTDKSTDVIAWDTEQIQSHIAKLKSVTADMENARSSLSALREQVATNWSSNAATTYLTEMSIDLDDFKVFIDNVGVLDSALNTVLNIFTDCETSVTSSMKTLDAQLDTLQSQSAKATMCVQTDKVV